MDADKSISEFLNDLQKIWEKCTGMFTIALILIMGISSLIESILFSLGGKLSQEIIVLFCAIFATFIALVFATLYYKERTKSKNLLKSRILLERSVSEIDDYLKMGVTEGEIEKRRELAIETMGKYLIYSPEKYVAPNVRAQKTNFKINLKEAVCNPRTCVFFAVCVIMELTYYLEKQNLKITYPNVIIGAHTDGNPTLVAKVCEYLDKDLYVCNSAGIGLKHSNDENKYEIYPEIDQNSSDDLILIFIHDVNMGMRRSVQACTEFESKGIKTIHYFVLFNRLTKKYAEGMLSKEFEDKRGQCHFHSCIDFPDDEELQKIWDKEGYKRRV